MNPENPNSEILLKRSGTLTRPAVIALAHRGLTDLEATEEADRWLELAVEHIRKENCHARTLKWDLKLCKKRQKSSEYIANMSAYIDCLRRAATAKPDYALPLINIAEAYLYGLGVTKSRIEALSYLCAAAAVASTDDLWKMSWVVSSGEDSDGHWPEGTKEAEKWCRTAAEQGHPGAQYSLGKMYSEGKWGLRKNYELAKYWFSKASEDGDFPSAEHLLGVWWKK